MADLALLTRAVPAPNVDMLDRETVTAYRDLCAEIGVVNPEIVIDDFKYWLNDADMPVFGLAGVTSYMDELTAKDNPSKMGWEWLPVRASDRIEHTFGRPATEDRASAELAILQAYYESMRREATRGFFGGAAPRRAQVPRIEIAAPTATITPASDYYAGPEAKVYDRAIPAHALRKIARIEKEFGAGRVAFMITDYVTKPHVVINPDPFLMAVVPNKDVGKGIGRFVIDVWDEPNFGIAQMLK